MSGFSQRLPVRMDLHDGRAEVRAGAWVGAHALAAGARARASVGVLLGACALLGAAGLPRVAAAASGGHSRVVQIDSGKLSGVVAGKIAAFKGIPYAAPPVGALRWKPPQSVAAWEGVKVADKVGPVCMQTFTPEDAGVGPAPVSEDCLKLDVYSPARAKGLPVMLWIHGGGYVNGSGTAALYDGTELAKQGVVVVSINYRLGRFGFFAHPALTQESPDGPLGNYGFMDQIASLQWVQRNIAAFGGDPHDVTIFGESAGGGSVINLLTSPLARGLFQRAISESGIARTPLMQLHLPESAKGESAEDQGRLFAARMGVLGDDVAALRAIPAQKIIDAGEPDWRTSGPMIDGKVVVMRPDDAFAQHQEAPVPFLLGSNGLEFPPDWNNLQHAGDMVPVPAVHGARITAAYGGDEATNTNIVSDVVFTEPARFLGRTHSTVAPVYLYRFNVMSPHLPPTIKAAPHASDRQYVFKNLASLGKPVSPSDQQAAEWVSAYWVAFAKTGDPNGGKRVVWPKYSAAADELLDMENDGPVVEKVPNAAALDAIGGLYGTAEKK